MLPDGPPQHAEDATPVSLLLVEDSPADAELMLRELRRAGLDVVHERVDSRTGLVAALERGRFDAVICDFVLPGMRAPEVLDVLEERGVECPVIVVSGTVGEDLAVAMIQAGATDYVMKSSLVRLPSAVRRALREAEAERARRAAELAQQEVAATLSAVVRASPLAIVGLDAEARVTLWTPAAERLFGWSEEEVRGRPAPFVPEERRDEHAGLVRRVLAGEELHAVSVRRRNREGRLLDVSLSVAPLRDAEERIVGVVCLLRDVTDEVRAAAERAQLEEQLRHSQKMEAVGRLAAGVAHDFNNILTAIQGYAEIVAAATEPGDERRQDVEQIVQAAERAAALTKRLLTFSRRERIEPAELDVNDLVSGLEPLLRRVVGESVELRLEPGRGLPPVLADPGLLEQALLNLAVNARDAMPEGGTVTVATDTVDLRGALADRNPELPPGPYVRIAVSDTGEGMSEEVRTRAFEPFFTTKPREQGTGLGLATVWGIVRQAGGGVELDSTPGRGTSVRILLPARVGATAGPPGANGPPAAPESTGTILVVEDDPAVRSYACRILGEHGYAVLSAAESQAALEVAGREVSRIDLVLTDLVLPGMGGAALVARLRELRPGLPALAMSGYSGEELVRGGEPSGLDVLQKPFSRELLLRKVYEALTGGGAEAAPAA